MRIRKHASSIASKPPATTTHMVCELNRSPWDVIPFTPQSEFDYQLKIEDEFTWNSVGKEPLHAPQRTFKEEHSEQVRNKYQCKEEEEEEEEDMKSLSLLSHGMKKKAKKKLSEKKKKIKDDNYIRCIKTDGKTWQCKKEAQQGEAFCQHHLVQLKSYHNKYYHSTKKPKLKAAKPTAKAEAGTASASTTLVANKKINRGRVQTKPADFYYYSGFGPSWGKKRGGDEITKEPVGVVDDGVDEASSSSLYIDQDQDQAVSFSTVNAPSSDHDNDRVFYDSDDDDEDEEVGDVGKTRVRKPIKERSLNSLF